MTKYEKPTAKLTELELSVPLTTEQGDEYNPGENPSGTGGFGPWQ